MIVKHLEFQYLGQKSNFGVMIFHSNSYSMPTVPRRLTPLGMISTVSKLGTLVWGCYRKYGVKIDQSFLIQKLVYWD